MGRLNDLKEAMNRSGMKMGHDINAVKDSVYEQVAATQTAVSAAEQSGRIIREPEEETVSAAETSEDAPTDVPVNNLLDFYIRLAGSFCRLNGGVITNNVLTVLQGLPEDVRAVSMESAVFIANHFGDMIAAMVLNHDNIRAVVSDALKREMDTVKMSEADRKKEHDAFGGYPFDAKTHVIELGATMYTDDVSVELADRVLASMDAITGTKIMDMVDDVLDNRFSQKDADEIGLLLSNPVYLLILFNNNAEFVMKISGICRSLHEAYE